MNKDTNMSKKPDASDLDKKNEKTQVTIRLDTDVIEYFRKIARKNNTPYQPLINSYLKYCMQSKKQPETHWV